MARGKSTQHKPKPKHGTPKAGKVKSNQFNDNARDRVMQKSSTRRAFGDRSMLPKKSQSRGRLSGEDIAPTIPPRDNTDV